MIAGNEPLIIRPTRPFRLGLAEVWDARELLRMLVVRDIKIRHKQTILGLAWIILQPLAPALLFTVMFTRVASLDTGGVSYLVYTLSALTGWNYIARAVSRAGNIFLAELNLVSKVYIPRLVLPLSALLGSLLDLAAGFGCLVAAYAFTTTSPTSRILAVPVILLLVVLAAAGVSLWAASLSVRFRDVVLVLPVFVQLWLFASPVAYSLNVFERPVQLVLAINPASGPLEAMRWALTGSTDLWMPVLAVSVAVNLAVVVSGLAYFRATERNFADIL